MYIMLQTHIKLGNIFANYALERDIPLMELARPEKYFRFVKNET